MARLAVKVPVFSDINNKRSMIYIDNLSEFVRLTVDYEAEGLYFSQNKDYVNITDLVTLIAKAHGKELKHIKMFNFAVNLGLKFSKTFQRVFGSLIYDKEMLGSPGTVINGYIVDYETNSFDESIIKTEIKVRNYNK